MSTSQSRSNTHFPPSCMIPFLTTSPADRWRRLLATVAGAALMAGVFPTILRAQEAQTHFNDVEAGAWYETSAAALLELGALDPAEPRLRPDDLATRAEMVKLLVRVNDLPLPASSTPMPSNFDDVRVGTWYHPYFELAAQQGWVRGDGDCYQSEQPCMARPASNINRAEAAALLQRAFNLSYSANAPVFPDVMTGEWFFIPIQAAADACILQGDDMSDLVRPGGLMNRAEMIAMFHRAAQDLRYGTDCGVDDGQGTAIEEVTVLSGDRIRILLRI